MKDTKEISEFLERVADVYFEGIETWDYPDFCDAYIAQASFKDSDGTWREATDEELDIINENVEYFYDDLIQQVF